VQGKPSLDLFQQYFAQHCWNILDVSSINPENDDNAPTKVIRKA
jgi:hypothetical protein